MRFPATPGWVSLPVVVGAPRHSWLRAPGAVLRHSWLGSSGGGGVWPLATPGCGSSLRFPATPGWGVRRWRWRVGPCHSWLRVSCAVPRHSWLGSAGRGGGRFSGWGFPVLCVLVARRVRVVSVLVCVVCVRGVCVGGGAGLGVPSACVCVHVCVRVSSVGGVWLPVLASSGCCWCWWGCGWCVLWLVPRHSWLGFAAGGGGRSSPLLAEGPRCGSPPLLAGVRRRWLCAAPRHSWLGPAGCGGVFRGWGCPLLCVFVVCVASRRGRAALCVACLWCPRCWWCGVVERRGCVLHVRRCAWLRVCGVPVVRGLLSPPLWLGLAAGVCVGVVRVWCGSPATSGCGTWVLCPATPGWGPPLCGGGWSLATPGCGAPPLLAGVHRRCGGWSLATPGRVPWAWFPATPGWGPPVVVVGARSQLLAVGPGVPGSLALVCVCVLCGASCWCGWCAGAVCGVVAVCVRVCVYFFSDLFFCFLNHADDRRREPTKV